MSQEIVTNYLISLIAKQVEDNGLVVWYDPDKNYTDVVKKLKLPNTEVFCYEGSFFHLRWRIDQQKLMDGEEPPRLVVYVPMAQDKTHHALIELEAAGVIMQPGQQPPPRNTRLAVVAYNALKGVLGEEAATEIEKKAEAGRLTLADLDALADKSGEISKGVIALIFGTGNPQEVALSFLDNYRFDEIIAPKDAKGELAELLGHEFGFDAPDGAGLDDLRRRLARHVLMTDLISGLGETVPSSLASVPVATTPAATAACVELARAWRLRRDRRNSYVAAALRVEKEFNLDSLTFEPEAMKKIETFPAIERALLRHAENRLLEETDGDMLLLAESRKAGFWCDAEPKLQARWALVAAAAEVLLEAERVEKALKKSPRSITGMVKEYAEGTEPWCLLDTRHRQMESHWYNFEPHGDDHDSIEKLVIQARRRYMAVGSEIARLFLECLAKEGLPTAHNQLSAELLRQCEVFENHVKPFLAEKKTAYVWVDALRFEMGRELARLLREDFEVELHPALAAVPTVTEIGMAALLPGAQGDAKVVTAGSGKLALEINGTVIKDRKDRLTLLKEHAGVEVFDTKLDNLLPKPSKKVREGIENAQLILVTSQEIDELCEQDNITQARRQMDDVLNDLRRGIRMLVNMGIERIVLAADHGHLFADELSEDMKVDSPGGETADLHRRVWVGHGGNADDAFLRAPLSALGMEGDFDLATPWTFACFKCKGGAKAFFHGGLSPQELLVPVMILSPSSKPSAGPPVGITWKLVPGSQKLTTRFFSVQIVGMNSGLFDIAPPKVRVELRAKGKIVSRAVSASYGFEEATGDVALRNDESDHKKIAPNTITLMITEEPDQKSVGLYLLDAATGAELARLEKIEVSIAM
uniref:PglZ domain-containing protein n=1 Tax=Desulfomonile tiedjei TaxID=2358 RepID=A0A7C4ATD1_9BACT